jgi:biopolymer transport protein ExbB
VNTLVQTLLNQSPLMIVLFGMSVLCGAVILDRSWFWLSSVCRYRPLPSVSYLRTGQAARGILKRLQACKRRHYTEELILAGMGPSASREHLMQTASEQIDRMGTRLGMLDLIARIAPLVGILGTVVGMASSFGGIGALVSATPAAISSGISVALQSTAYGLVLSIVASVTAAAFRRGIHQATLKMGRIVCELQTGK